MRCLIVALAILALVPPRCSAQIERKPFSFAPQPPDRSGSFLVTESGVNLVAVKVPNGHFPDRFLYTDSFGFMKNVGRSAFGASIDAHLTKATSTQTKLKLTPTLRYKRWLGKTQSLDLMLGYVPNGTDPGLEGPIGTLRYSPLTSFSLQAGVCQFREVNRVPGAFPYQYREERKARLFAGACAGGVPGVVLWGVEVATLLVFAAGMSGSGW